MTRPVAIDLFSGCGGVSEGLRQAGFRIAAAVEVDDLAAETYVRNHPRTALLHHDIRDLRPKQLRRNVLKPGEQVAVLAACAPCQGFSRLPTRNQGPIAEDPRNDLVLRILPFVVELRPFAVMLENVPGAKDSPQMTAVRQALKAQGYVFQEAVLNVADFGVPQSRRRYILIAARGGPLSFPERAPDRCTVRHAIAHLPPPGMSGDPLHDVAAKRRTKTEALIARIPPDGGSRNVLPDEEQLRCHRLSDGFSDVYGRMWWDRPAPTITSGFVNPSKGRFLHPSENRTITPREAALLQGFPPQYFFSMRRGKYGAAEMIGNAVPPEFVRRQAAIIRKVM